MDILKKISKDKYINNNPMYGLDYDYNKVRREFNKMLKACNAPAGLYNPCALPLDQAKYFSLFSERSSSKTTQILLFALTFWKLYGTTVAYLRQYTQQITRKMYDELFEVINNPQWGYIEYLTEGKYNRVVVTVDKKCYFAKFDDNGKEVERTPHYVLLLLAVELSEIYTSTLNTVTTDIVIFDEFTRTPATAQDFVDYMQILATIRRERKSLRIFMLSNTITPYHNYLRELGISDYLAQMKRGQHAIITSPLGARVYCELLDVGIHQNKEFKVSALEYFGFANEALKSIYGGEWEIKGFRHIPRGVTPTYHYTGVIFEFMGNYLALQTFADGKQYGAFISPFTGKIKPSYTVITDKPTYNNKNLTLAGINLIRKLSNIDREGHLYFANNQAGLLYESLKSAITTGKVY